MFDVGGFGGYRRRTVKIIPVAGLWGSVTEIDDSKINKSHWTKVDEDYNPFNWKEI